MFRVPLTKVGNVLRAILVNLEIIEKRHLTFVVINRSWLNQLTRPHIPFCEVAWFFQSYQFITELSKSKVFISWFHTNKSKYSSVKKGYDSNDIISWSICNSLIFLIVVKQVVLTNDCGLKFEIASFLVSCANECSNILYVKTWFSLICWFIA